MDIANYSQFGGGWLNVINARVTSGEQAVAEQLIGELLKADNAVDIFQNTGKVSPTVEGKTKFNDTSDPSGIARATYATTTVERPTDSAFSGIWEVYANTIGAAADQLSVLTTADVNTFATGVATTFVTAIKAYVTNKNAG